MKKLTLCLMALCLSLTFIPAQSKAATAATKPITTAVANPVDAAKAQVLELRLNEINQMDKSTMLPSEKRQLRKEVRTINKQLNEMGGGIYISVGAVIIILLLLIILL